MTFFRELIDSVSLKSMIADVKFFINWTRWLFTYLKERRDKKGSKRAVADCLIVIATVLLTIYACYEFMNFMFWPQVISQKTSKTTVNDFSVEHFASLCWDVVLMTQFFISHSWLKASRMGPWLPPSSVRYARIIYVWTSCASLILMCSTWSPVDIFLWQIVWTYNVINYTRFRSVQYFVQAFAYVYIYSNALKMDLPELLGISQIFDDDFDYIAPSAHRNQSSMQRFLKNSRHGSFTALFLIFWIMPAMTLDGLLLAITFTVYMYVRWNPDQMDLNHVSSMWSRKRQEQRRQVF